MVHCRIPAVLCGLLLACNVLATHPSNANPVPAIARNHALNPRGARPPSPREDFGFDSDTDPPSSDDDDDDDDDDDENLHPSSGWEFGRFGDGDSEGDRGGRPGRFGGAGGEAGSREGGAGSGAGRGSAGGEEGAESGRGAAGRGGGRGGGERGGLAFDREKATQVRNVHGVLAAVTFVGVFPLGAIILRVATGHVWLHAGVQMLGYCAFVAAAGLGIWLTTYVRIPTNGGSILNEPSVNFHPIIGLVVLAALSLQPIFGLLHHSRFKRVHRRQIWSHLHLWTGRLAIPLGIVNGALGLVIANATTPVLASYSAVAAVVWLVWMAFAVWSERRRRRDGRLARAVEESAAKREEEERERRRIRRRRDSRSSG